MISTETLMAGKALLTATALLGFGFWQLHALRQLKRQKDTPKPGKNGVDVPNSRPGTPGD